MIKTLQAIHRFLDVSRVRRYGLAVLLTGLVTAISRVFLADHLWVTCATLAAAAVSSARFGGRGPGLLSTIFVPVVAWTNLAAAGDSTHPLALLFWTALAGSLALVAALADGNASALASTSDASVAIVGRRCAV